MNGLMDHTDLTPKAEEPLPNGRDQTQSRESRLFFDFPDRGLREGFPQFLMSLGERPTFISVLDEENLRSISALAINDPTSGNFLTIRPSKRTPIPPIDRWTRSAVTPAPRRWGVTPCMRRAMVWPGRFG